MATVQIKDNRGNWIDAKRKGGAVMASGTPVEALQEVRAKMGKHNRRKWRIVKDGVAMYERR